MPEVTQSVFRRWRVGIVAAVLVFGGLVAVRAFLDYQANAPIVDPYLTTINDVAARSARARQRLAEYYAKHQRQTVASKHYPWLCSELQDLARQDGVTDDLHCPFILDTYEKL